MYAYKVNLLPPQLQREGIIDFRRLILVGAATLLVAVILSGYGFFLINYFSMKNELASNKQQQATLSPLVSRVEGMVKERKELEAALEEYNVILKKHMAWSNLLYDLGDIAPVDLWLTDIDISNKTPAAKEQNAGAKTDAASKAGAQPKEEDRYARPNTISYKGISQTVPSIGVFIRNLTMLPYFEEVKLVKIESDLLGAKFEITAKVKDEK
ncbi:PilN domain-containing protein [Pelotomaculum propionicicum]|uniref:Fimbrial assembly protein (PilN) n=1 Tax=Pelotomaculum propionicicum TaxID=258475 RepID=A0A4Y7RL75_9FIRM|nr:PilN domain-containing protein [Pelotomaculum propionicicum]NLI11357.1 PilN domain-containing protein [Peptococcaceae bacterium]TEB09576.1 hypothetical protein Pmgp_03007 [Pelotomaculum propionicicum]